MDKDQTNTAGPWEIRPGNGYVSLTLKPNLISQATYHLTVTAARRMAELLEGAVLDVVDEQNRAEIAGEIEVVEVDTLLDLYAEIEVVDNG